MNLRYITCSGIDKHNSIYDMFNLMQIDNRVELAVQAHTKKMSDGMPRNVWFNQVLDYAINNPKLYYNFAVHVNTEWCKDICNGYFPYELSLLFGKYNEHGKPLIKRWQLNIPAEFAEKTNINKVVNNVAELIENNSDRNFIIQYKPATIDIVRNLHRQTQNFSILFDESGGKGKSPVAWQYQPYNLLYTGYSGGLSPQNIKQNLSKIDHVAPVNRYTWVDAEKNLKNDNDLFDVQKAEQYIRAVLEWEKQNQR